MCDPTVVINASTRIELHQVFFDSWMVKERIITDGQVMAKKCGSFWGGHNCDDDARLSSS